MSDRDEAKRTRWNSTIRANPEAQPLPRGKPPRVRNAKRKGHRFPKTVDESYRRWIRARPCLLGRRLPWWTGIPCEGPVECDHVKTRGAGGADIGNCVPLCTFHHRLRHSIGIRTFERDWDLDLAKSAKELGEWYTDRIEEPF